MNDINDAALEHAEQFVAYAVERGVSRPAVVPCPDGSAQLEWHQDGIDVEVVVGNDGVQEVFYVDSPLEWHAGGGSRFSRSLAVAAVDVLIAARDTASKGQQ